MNPSAGFMGALLLMVSCATLAATPDASSQDFNPFSESYVSRLPVPATKHESPRVFAGQDKVEDYYRLLEDGYDMLGYSSFKFRSTPPEKLMDHATSLNAEVVLVYTEGIGNLARHSEGQPDEAVSKEVAARDETLYEYFATYWVRLPKPLLGVHVQRENLEDDAGLEVLAVIKGSPAATSGLMRGDVLHRIGDVELHKPEQLSQAAQRYAGQSVVVAGQHDGSDFTKIITLNQR
jgi:membrane-associated protease RseP (regulator of RpoE activity)